MPGSRSTRKCRFNNCCCCNPFLICSSMLGLRRSPLCKSSLGSCILTTDLTVFAARKPSSSNNTPKTPNEDTEQGAGLKAMAPDPHAVNGNENNNNAKVEKPTMIAKEPTVAKPMVYEPKPVQKPNGLSNGTTNHTSYSMNQRKTMLFSKLSNTITDPEILQARSPVQVPPRLRANPVSYFHEISRSHYSKKRSSQHDESLLLILII